MHYLQMILFPSAVIYICGSVALFFHEHMWSSRWIWVAKQLAGAQQKQLKESAFNEIAHLANMAWHWD